ncbi:MAG: ABC transporter transmembrane domain-containing protein [Deltaproteobacteria bacterium]|nr:ABC transporter transmembrane domain-containing protein [Deltaproteobacteria bacterium]
MSSDSSSRRLGILLRLVELLRPHKLRFAVATVALMVGSLVALVYPQAARYAIDEGLGEGGSREVLDQVALFLAILFALHAGVVWIRHYLMSWLGDRAVADLRRQSFDGLVYLPVGWFHLRRTGELIGRLSADIAIIEGFVGSQLSIALRNLIQLIGGLTLLLWQSPLLTLIMVAVVPPMMLAMVVLGRKIRRMSREVQDRLAETSGDAQESLGAIQTVQAFVRETFEQARYGEGIERAFGSMVDLARWRATFMATVTVAGYAAIAAILWIGGRWVVDGRMSGGDLAAFMIYTSIVGVAVASLAGLWGTLQRAAGATERIFEIIDTLPEIRDPASPRALPEGGGAVRFEGVHFTYPARPEQEVLEGVDFEIHPGELVAAVGPSGAGKTTLTALLFRFFDPTAGAVRLEGVDLRELALADLRGAMAMVEQEPVLFSGTIAENIAYGRPGATPAEIEAAARDANAHDFVTAFPEGYQTLLGERGVRVSGGQRQRLAIARALLANPRLLILDEATSNLDAESEALVQEALSRLMHERTTFVIAHRLSTVRDADRILVFDQGRLVETGDHESLMTSDGVYRRLVERQLSE